MLAHVLKAPMQKPVLVLPGIFISTVSVNGLNAKAARRTLIVTSMIKNVVITVIRWDEIVLTEFVMRMNVLPMNGLRLHLKIRIVVNMRVLEN